MPGLIYDTIGEVGYDYSLVCIDSIANDSELIDELVEWCDTTEDVKRSGQLVHFYSGEAATMFKLIFE